MNNHCHGVITHVSALSRPGIFKTIKLGHYLLNIFEKFLKYSETWLEYSGQSNLGIISRETVALKLSSREFCNSWYKSVNIYLFIYHKLSILSLNKQFVYNPKK